MLLFSNIPFADSELELICFLLPLKRQVFYFAKNENPRMTMPRMSKMMPVA